jgi:hypothetical protein
MYLTEYTTTRKPMNVAISAIRLVYPLIVKANPKTPGMIIQGGRYKKFITTTRRPNPVARSATTSFNLRIFLPRRQKAAAMYRMMSMTAGSIIVISS